MAVAYPPDDPIRSYSDDEVARLTAQLTDLLRRIRAGEFAQESPTLELLTELHRQFFAGVRDHAGRIRSPGFGSDRLIFGPQRSAARDDVPRLLEEIFAEAKRSFVSLLANPQDPQFVGAACTWRFGCTRRSWRSTRSWMATGA